DAATVADHAAVLDPFILAAGAFPVLDGTENALAEEAALFRLEGAVIDGLGILDFALGPGTDGIRGGDGDRHVFHLIHLFQSEQLAGAFFSADHTVSLILAENPPQNFFVKMVVRARP